MQLLLSNPKSYSWNFFLKFLEMYGNFETGLFFFFFLKMLGQSQVLEAVAKYGRVYFSHHFSKQFGWNDTQMAG